MRASSVRIPLLAVSLLLLGVPISQAKPLTMYIVRAEMPVRPNGLAIDSEGRIWLTLQGSPPSLGMVNAAACARRSDCRPTEFPLPDADALPKLVAVDRHDKVWLTAYTGDSPGRVYKFDPDTERFDPPYETPGSDPYDIAVDSRGIVWFTDQNPGTVNSIHEGRVVEEYETPEESRINTLGAYGLAVDSDNAVWCACGKDLVRIFKSVTRAPGRTSFIRYPIPDAAIPHGVFAETPNRIWIMDQGSNRKHGRLIRFTRRLRVHRACTTCGGAPLAPSPLVDTFDDWPLPAFGKDGENAVIDPHWLVVRAGTLYFTGFAVGVVGTFDTRRETFGAYLLSPGRDDDDVVGGNTGAYDIAVDPNGRVWFTEVQAGAYSLSRVAAVRRLPLRD